MKTIATFCLFLTFIVIAVTSGARAATPADGQRVEADRNLSAQLGDRLLDRHGHAVGIVEDFRFDVTGAATAVIVQDGGFFGREGDLVSLPYLSAYTPRAEGDVPRAVTPASKRLARPAAATTGGVTASALLHASIYEDGVRRLAEIEDYTLADGHLTNILFVFGAVPGRPARLVAVPFAQLSLHGVAGNGWRFDMRADQVRALRQFIGAR